MKTANDNQPRQPFDWSLLLAIVFSAAIFLLLLRALADPWLR
jgi:hypothetical protein